MTDRLAEIEGIRDALHDTPDDISVPVSAGLARDLLWVYQRADSAAGFDVVDGVRYCRACDYAEALCKCKPRIHGLRAALARFDQGARHMSECPHGEERGPGFACPPCQPAPQPAPEGGWSAAFPARFPHRCLHCDADIIPGDLIRWRTGDAAHDDCHEGPA